MTSTHELPGSLDGGGSSKETWKSEIRAAMDVWAAAFNTNWPQLTITFEAAENTVDDGEELPNSIETGDTYDLPHEKGIGDFRFGRHPLEGTAAAHALYPQAHMFLTSYGRSDEGTFGGDVHFDLDTFTWRADGTPTTAINNLSILVFAVHELGHSLGLTHVDEQPGTPNWKPIMYPVMESTVNFSDDTGERPYGGSVTAHDLNCLKSLYEDGPPEYETDCNIDCEDCLAHGWPSIIAAIDRINNEGSTSEAITITYSFYVGLPKLHSAGGGGGDGGGGGEDEPKLKQNSDDCCEECKHCEDGKAPKAWKVVFDKIADHDPLVSPFCETCAEDYNKTFILAPAGGRAYWPATDKCMWDYLSGPGPLPAECYAAYGVSLMVYEHLGEYFIHATLDGLTAVFETIEFRESYDASPPNCNNQNDVQLSPHGPSNFFRCDTSEATCRITACE